ncbi:MAG TPA: hypothetical protein VEC60_14075 [Reyranella sp.]|nr:hypothetical protein [Reyranella sp.]
MFERLGAPHLKLEGLQIWVHGRQFPDAHDYWDGNWLRATAHCGGSGASVFVSGSFIHLGELDRWRIEAQTLQKDLSGEAKLACIEPELSVDLKSTSLGHIVMEVQITPNNLTQRHWFQFEIDQTYLTPLIDQCQSILGEYPIRDSRT